MLWRLWSLYGHKERDDQFGWPVFSFCALCLLVPTTSKSLSARDCLQGIVCNPRESGVRTVYVHCTREQAMENWIECEPCESVCTLTESISSSWPHHHLASKLGVSKQKNPNCQRSLSVLPLNPKPCTDAFQAKQKSTKKPYLDPSVLGGSLILL
jgi:hypothetical protein